MTRRGKYPVEIREQAVRIVCEHQAEHASQWATITSIASKFGRTAETLRTWVRRAEVDAGARAGLTTGERERLRQLERENRELRRANEILKAASVFLARELDPRLPKGPASSRPTASASGSSRSVANCRSPRRRTPPHGRARDRPVAYGTRRCR